MYVDPGLLAALSVNVGAEVSGSKITLRISDRLERTLILPLAIPAVLGMCALFVVAVVMTLTGHSTSTLRDTLFGIVFVPIPFVMLWRLGEKMGAETLQLAPDGIEYEGGIGPWRRGGTCRWTEISSLHTRPKSRWGIQWRQTGSGRMVGIGRNISVSDVHTVLKILQQYQAAALRTPAVNS